MSDTQVQQQAMLLMALASLGKRLESIEKRLDGKTPVLSVEEAVETFKEYLKENAKPNTRRSFDYLLSEFKKEFVGQNVPEITAEGLQRFLHTRWGAGKKSVVKQSLSKLKWFFSWCVKAVQVKGMPPFLNPCDLIEVRGDEPPVRPEFVPVEKMMEFLQSMTDEKHWLMTAILMTSGMRVSELIGDKRADKPGLRKKDVDGRVLALENTKSGRKGEVAVIPSWVSERLNSFLQKLSPEDRIFPIGYTSYHGVVKSHGKRVGSLKPHFMRKWIASYWNRLGEYQMVNFILRHATTKVNDAALVTALGARYVAPLSPQEVMERQDRMLNFMGGVTWRSLSPESDRRAT